MHEKMRRPVAILAALALVFGLFPSAALAGTEGSEGGQSFTVLEDLEFETSGDVIEAEPAESALVEGENPAMDELSSEMSTSIDSDSISVDEDLLLAEENDEQDAENSEWSIRYSLSNQVCYAGKEGVVPEPPEVEHNGCPADPSMYSITYKSKEETQSYSAGTPLKPGKYEVIVTFSGKDLPLSYELTVYDAYDLSSYELWEADGQTVHAETGKAIEPEVQGYSYVDSTPLVVGEHIKISGYRNADGDSVLAGPPSTAGSYVAVYEGISPYFGQAELAFKISKANDLALADVTLTKGTDGYFAHTGSSIDPGVQVVMAGTTLREGVDYTIEYELENASETGPASSLVDIGVYRVKIEAVAGGAYVGAWHSADWGKGWIHVVDKHDVEGASIELVDGRGAKYEWTGSAITPNVVVRNVAGDVLAESQDYELVFRNTAAGFDDLLTSVSDEGSYEVMARGLGSYAKGEEESGESDEWSNLIRCNELTPHFYIVKPEHDLANATVSMRTTFSYDEGEDEQYGENDGDVARSLEKVLKPVVVLNGETLTEGIDSDYRLFFNRAGFGYSGTLGKHTLLIVGNGDEYENCPYYGKYALTYIVVDDSAPALDTRKDADTGVTIKGDVISEESTTADDKWVKLSVSEPTGNGLELAAAEAKAAADAAGALSSEVFAVTLDIVGGDGSTTPLTEGFNITLTFPVDAKYNGRTATITQIHDGNALAPKTATVANGAVSIQVDCLSQFVVSVNGDTTAEPLPESGNGSNPGTTTSPAADAQNEATAVSAADSGSRAATSSTYSAISDALPSTGDGISPFAVLALAVAAGFTCIVARRFARR